MFQHINSMFFMESVLDTSLWDQLLTLTKAWNHLFLSGHLPTAFSVIKLYLGLFCYIPWIPFPPFSEPVQGLACVHHLLPWTLTGCKMKIWGEFVSAEGQMEVFRECQDSKALQLCCLHSSPFLLLLSVPICYLLLQVIAELHSSSCTHFWITDWLHEKKKKKKNEKREAVFYIVSSPSGSGEILLHTGSFFPASDTAVTSLSPELCPPELSTFPLSISTLKQCPAFFHHFPL